MSKFGDRFRRLLDYADYPIPGDRVRVKDRARHKVWRGKTGKVVKIWGGADIEIDGEVRPVTVNSLEVIEDE